MKILFLYKGYPTLSHVYQSSEAEELNKKHLPYTFNDPLKGD